MKPRMASRLVAAMVVALAAACGSSFDGYCSQLTQCTGGNDKDTQVCIDTLEGQKKVADDYGCGAQLDSFVRCTTTNTSCKGGYFATENNCANAQQALDTCSMNASSLGRGTDSGYGGSSGSSSGGACTATGGPCYTGAMCCSGFCTGETPTTPGQCG